MAVAGWTLTPCLFPISMPMRFAMAFNVSLSTGVAFELPFPILQRSLNDFILVDDSEIDEAVRVLLQQAHVLAEPAGAAPTAAAFNQRGRLQGRKVVLVVSGANITRDQLKALL